MFPEVTREQNIFPKNEKVCEALLKSVFSLFASGIIPTPSFRQPTGKRYFADFGEYLPSYCFSCSNSVCSRLRLIKFRLPTTPTWQSHSWSSGFGKTHFSSNWTMHEMPMCVNQYDASRWLNSFNTLPCCSTAFHSAQESFAVVDWNDVFEISVEWREERKFEIDQDFNLKIQESERRSLTINETSD